MVPLVTMHHGIPAAFPVFGRARWSEFVSAAVIEKAEAFHGEEVDIYQVDSDTADRMLQALDAPAEPNEFLKEIITMRQRHISNGRFFK